MTDLMIWQNLDAFHDMIDLGKDRAEVVEQYKKYVCDELGELQDAIKLGEIAKEAIDVIVVCRPIVRFGTVHQKAIHFEITKAMIRTLFELGIDWQAAMTKVNESNYSKLVLRHEIDATSDHFAKAGIEVRIESLGGDYFGAFSWHDQTVGTKTYTKDKLLKSQNYHEIDESTEWWTL